MNDNSKKNMSNNNDLISLTNEAKPITNTTEPMNFNKNKDLEMVEFKLKDINIEGTTQLSPTNEFFKEQNDFQMEDVSDNTTDKSLPVNEEGEENSQFSNNLIDDEQNNLESDNNLEDLQKDDSINDKDNEGQEKSSDNNSDDIKDNEEQEKSSDNNPDDIKDNKEQEKSSDNNPDDIKNNDEDRKDDLNNKKENLDNNPKESNNSKDDQTGSDKSQDQKQQDNNQQKNSNDKPKEPEKSQSNLDKKRDQLKDNSNNKKPNNNQKGNSGSGVKDKLKNRAKNAANNMKNNAIKNSEMGQKAQGIKDKYDKAKKGVDTAKKAGKAAAKAGKAAGKVAVKAAKGLIQLFIETLPWSAIVLAVVLAIALIIVLFATFTPGIAGDVNDEENRKNNYSEVDQKTLEKMQELADKYPNSDPTLAMATVLYPYYDTLWDGNVSAILGADNNEATEEDTETDEEASEDSDVGDDISKDENSTEEDDIYLEPFRKRSVRKKLKKVFKLIDGKTNYASTSTSSGTSSDAVSTSSGNFSGTKYNLPANELTWIARLCQQEQGSAQGAAAEASLIANKYELSGSKIGIYNYVHKSSWWNLRTSSSGPSKSVLEAVKDVLLNGNRVFPTYVDEHDCIDCGSYGYDITKIKNGSKVITDKQSLKNHSNYIKDKTIIYNGYESVYTFFSFPTNNSDPFGYTKSSYNKMNKGNTNSTSSMVNSSVGNSSITSTTNDGTDKVEEYSEALYDALNEYFDWDKGYWTYPGTNFNGYKKMFESVDEKKYDDLAKAIVEDLMDKKSLFVDYFYANKACSSTYQSAGTIEVNDLLKSNILIDVKTSSCNGNIDSCESMYDTPISLEKYIKGVTYEEIGVSGASDVEKIKAQMVAAKSYTLSRRTATKDSNGNYIIKMIANTNDQDYCDVDLGCKTGITSVSISSTGRDAVDSTTKSKLDEAWNVISQMYLYNTENKKTTGSYCQNRTGVCDKCKKGTCLSHEELNSYKGTDYMTILADQYSSYKLVSMQEGIASIMTPSAVSCTGINNDGSCGLPDGTYKYYSQKDYNTTFCGRSNSTISSSGCGVTSMAMVISNLTDETSITPIDTMNEAYSGGYCGAGIDGTSSGYFSVAAKKHGLTYKQLSVDKAGAEEAAKVLRSGGLIIANVNASSPFTSGGHYIVIRKIDAEGKIYVGDPYHKELNNTPYNLSSFINGWISSGHSWFAFTSNKSKDIVNKYCSTSSANNTNGKFSDNTRKNGQYSGQCIIYVQNRAVEIINSATSGYDAFSDRSKYANAWKNNSGNARDAFRTSMKSLFKTSTDYTKPQAGAVIVWDSTNNIYGHVAIIEKVNDNGTVLISQSNWCSNCEQFSKNTITLSQIKNYGGSHPFIGYIYLLQPIK